MIVRAVLAHINQRSPQGRHIHRENEKTRRNCLDSVKEESILTAWIQLFASISGFFLPISLALSHFIRFVSFALISIEKCLRFNEPSYHRLLHTGNSPVFAIVRSSPEEFLERLFAILKLRMEGRRRRNKRSFRWPSSISSNVVVQLSL